MRAIRLVLAALSIAFSVYAAATMLVPTYRCNVRIREAKYRMGRLFSKDAPAVPQPLLRANILELNECVSCNRQDYRLYMLLGWNYLRAERYAEAEKTFATGLRYQRRPELLASLGVAELNMGKTEVALNHFTEASLFKTSMLEYIPYDDVRLSVQQRVEEREKEIRNRQ